MSDNTRGQAASETGEPSAATQALPVPGDVAPASALGSRTGADGSAAGAAAGARGGSTGGAGEAGVRSPSSGPSRTATERRPSVPRPAARGEVRGVSGGRPPRARRARLALRRVDPWSVFLFSFLGSLCLGVVLMVAVAALYAMVSSLGVVASINQVFAEVTGGGPDSAPGAPLLTAGRALGAAGILALIDVVLVTALATLGALLYNLCASLTGGIELTLAEKD